MDVWYKIVLMMLTVTTGALIGQEIVTIVKAFHFMSHFENHKIEVISNNSSNEEQEKMVKSFLNEQLKMARADITYAMIRIGVYISLIVFICNSY